MTLPLTPPLAPMLGKLARELPTGDYVFEPKWDGFRCLVFRDGDEVDLRSRNDRPLARYFPEVVAALKTLPAERFVLDGELIVFSDGRFDFNALMSRLHPAASRAAELARLTPACFIAFDLLALGDDSFQLSAFSVRRAQLERLLTSPPAGIQLTPATDDAQAARAWLAAPAPEIDGVVAKRRDQAYAPGVRAMIKVKHAQTIDAVVGGMRGTPDPLRVTSLLLGLYDEHGTLHHIGVAAGFGKRRGLDLLQELEPLAAPLEGHPWEHGFLIGGGALGRLRGAAARWTPEMERDWVPLAPARVCEVAFDRADGGRLRYPGRLLRWRPDRDPASCTFDQFS
ncbi:MAG: ATP-dependent DNA ligase [Thermoleophilaceae bacterium]